MDEQGFRRFLSERDVSDDDQDVAVALVSDFEAYATEMRELVDARSAVLDDVDAFSMVLIETGRNTFDNYITLARYGLFIDNRAVYVANVAYVDGYEAYGNLHDKLGVAMGEARRDELFIGATVPPLGTPNGEKARLNGVVVDRLQSLDPEMCKQTIGTGLRDLPDEWYEGEKAKYESCGSVDAYIEERHQGFVADLEQHHEAGKWWWGQEVTEEMLAYVRDNPEVGGGVREGRVVYEAKIPYLTKEHVAAQDDDMKRYTYCHCPWARESLRDTDVEVPPVFCNCSAAFHKKPWDVIFGRELQADVLESVLAGDERCRFAIHLPDDAVLSREDASVGQTVGEISSR